ALAVENSRLAVTFIPLGCTGATIEDGLLAGQRARETACDGKTRCPSAVPAQLAQLRDTLALARRQRPDRNLDLVLLTIGANDIGFSQLVADVIIEAATERVIFRRAGLVGGFVLDHQAVAVKLGGVVA